MFSDKDISGGPRLVETFAIDATYGADDAVVACTNSGHCKLQTLKEAGYTTSWFGGGNTKSDGRDNTHAECQFKTQPRGNVTFCLSTAGICSFQMMQYDDDAVRVQANADIDQYEGANRAQGQMMNGQWAVQASMNADVMIEKEAQCIQIYKYTGGCVLLTGIDDANTRNNDYFDCNIVLMLMNYSRCKKNAGFTVTTTA